MLYGDLPEVNEFGAVIVNPGECLLCDRFPVATNDSGAIILRMTVFFTAGGSIPVGYSVNGPPNTEQVESGAYKADLITIQHTYSASFDLDLAPKVSVEESRLFDDDAFDNPTFLGPNIRLKDRVGNASASGFHVEDHNYRISKDVWPLGHYFGYHLDEPYFHLPTESPRLNPYEPYPDGTFEGEEPTETDRLRFLAIKRYLMTCNIGPNFLTGQADPANIVAVGQELPAAVPETMVAASNGGNLRLVTGPLSLYWRESIGLPTLAWVREGDSLVITFSGGILEVADSLTSVDWSPVNQNSPAAVPFNAPSQFLRVRQ